MKRTLLLPLSLCFLIITNHICIACHDEEREALLAFKNCQSGVLGTMLFSVWKSQDCCIWEGVSCSNRTGHVTKLNLPYITCDNSTGFLSSFSNFNFLRYLNISYSSIEAPIPHSFASLKDLKYLDMSNSVFNGTIPSYLGNLTNLEYIDMSFSRVEVGNLEWLCSLTFLQYVDLTNIGNLNESPDWYNYFSKLPNLRVLRLTRFNLSTLPSSSLRNNYISYVSTLELYGNNFQDPSNLNYLLNGSNSLVHLDLGYCEFNGTVPHVFGNLPFLVTLLLNSNHFIGTIPDNFRYLINLETSDISYNFLQGPIPAILGNLCNLITLDLTENQITGDISGMLGKPTCQTYNLQNFRLSGNKISGNIPDWIGKMRNLRYLYMFENHLNGSLPTSLGELSNLVVLGLSSNSMQGVVSEAHFENMTKLEDLYLYSNKFIFNISSTWIPPFQLQLINVRSCLLGPRFPSWLQNQKNLAYIDISNAQICDVIPSWLWNISSGCNYLNISNNCIRGELNVSDIYPSANVIDLSSNLIQGPIPYLNSSVTAIFLYNNSFSGQLQPILNEAMTNLQEIVLSRNNLTGEIPYGICEMGFIWILDLSYNGLTGEFPNCTMALNFLIIINLASNYLHGLIPQCIYDGFYPNLEVINLRNNNFSGEIPPLNNASLLLLLDLGYNSFTGNIPTWIGELTSLRFLSLHANKLNGVIPSELSLLPLQFLDLGNNRLSGIIPRSFAYLSAMKDLVMSFALLNSRENFIRTNISVGYTDDPLIADLGLLEAYEEILIANTKGEKLEYSSTITLVRILDLSDNKLTGIVPIELMNLTGLQTLNLSGNMLKGTIPDKIGTMEQLETLDLSRNRLSGKIPNSLCLLTKLSHLNLSYNNLSGKIPTGSQLQTLTDSSIYFHNNPNLCGTPLPMCYGDAPLPTNMSPPPLPPPPYAKNDEDGTESIDDDSGDMFDLYLSMGIGYAVGFWIIGGVFIFMDSWRIAYFRFLDNMTDRILLAKEVVKKRIFS